METKAQYGTKEKVITSKAYDDSQEEREQGVITYSFYGKIDEAIADAPKLGSRTQFFPELELQKRSFREGRDWTDVTLTYYKTEPESTDEESKEPSYSLQTEGGTQLILFHPRYEAASDITKTVGKLLIDGADPFAPAWYKQNGESIEISTEEKADFTESTLQKICAKFADTDKLGGEMIGKILKGIKEYAVSGATWTETVYKAGLTGTIDKLGKRCNPPGPNPNLDGDWRLAEVSAEKTRSGKLWKIVRKWKLSDAGATWDKELY